MTPEQLAPNLIDHFYLGGAKIAALRGIATTSERQPEEWLAATVTRAGMAPIGLARTVEGRVLRELVASDPTAWIGPEHAAARDAGDVGILVKLLDAGQRLPVHVHPERAFAASHLDCPYGKTEAWFVLDAEPGSAVYLGWKVPVDRAELDARRDAQDSEWMLERMHRIEVEPGMGILVPAGTVHAIDGGIFVAEVQEPTDFSIVLEWSITTSTREDSHLDLGFETVMPAVSVDPIPAEELAQLIHRSDLSARAAGSERLLGELADPYFRLHRVASGARVDAGFAVVLVLEGDGALVGDDEMAIHQGQVLAVPAGFGSWTVQGEATLLVARPGAGWPRTLTQGDVR